MVKASIERTLYGSIYSTYQDHSFNNGFSNCNYSSITESII